ncbi:MAG: L,D-transpeptidase family protein [Planctomycetota bacterium]
MARHPFSPQGRRKARNRTYGILAALVIIMVIAFMYGPFGKKPAPVESAPPPDVRNGVDPPEVREPVTVVPPSRVEPEPVVPQVVREPIPERMPEPTPPAPGPTVEPNPEATSLIAKATAFASEKPVRVIEARDAFNSALRMPMSAQQQKSVKEKLSELSRQWLSSRNVLPGDPLCETYLVGRGDLLETIGKRYKVPYEILMEINNISRPEALQAGSTIKIVNGPFHVKVSRSAFRMDVYLQNTYVRSYTVGLGKPGRDTPRGLWRVRPDGKAYATSWRDPDTGRVYQPEDPDYPLGSRWIGLEGLTGEAKGRDGFGIHGTKEPQEIGSATSRGCIRMFNGEVIQVYNMLFPGFSQVEVTD